MSVFVDPFVLQVARHSFYDLALVDNGALVGPSLVRGLKSTIRRVTNLNLDNPYTPRDGLRFRLFLKALPEYDVVFTPRQSSIEAARSRGAKRPMQFWQAADDRLKQDHGHPSEQDKAPYLARVSFTGSFMEDRDEIVLALRRMGIDIKINGPRWDRSPRRAELTEHLRLGALDQNQFYAAIAASDISLGLLSAGNLDLHTTRSVEIPALKSLLVAQRTSDHEALYEDGTEAFFWDTIEECADIIRMLLSDPGKLADSREAGYQRALANNHFNQPLMGWVVEQSLV